jgi:VCBS repeat-containing protein
MKSLRSALQVCLFLGFIFLIPGSFASASTVNLSGSILFSSLDGSAQDSDSSVNGVFTVSGDIVLDGTINCNDDPPLADNAGACPIRISVSGNMTMKPGSGIFAENRRGKGAGGNILLTVGGNLTLQGPSGVVPGAILSSSRLTDSIEPAGAITLSVTGGVVLQAGSTVVASSLNGAAGAIGITAGGTVSVAGLVASGPSRQVLATKLTGKILDGGKSNQAGGAILVRSNSSAGTGIRVEGSGLVVSQGELSGSQQLVLLEACGIEIRGLVASVLKREGPSQVVLRSGKGLLVDGRDLGVSGPNAGRLGRVRVDGVEGGSAGFMADLFAAGNIQVMGPDPAVTSLSAVSSSPGTLAQRSGGTITAISQAGDLSASGNAFEAGKALTGDKGGIIDLQAKGNATLDGANLRAVGDFTSSSPGRKGGSISVRSFQGAISWTFGLGDVRPVGAGAPNSTRGSITLTACSGIDTTGSQFPTVGSAVLPFPVENDGVCAPAAPSLPSGEPPLPVCNRPPVADAQTVTTDEDTPKTITLTGSDPDGQPLTFSIVTPPAHGSLGALTSPTATSVQVVYTPTLNYNGPDSFTFQVDDGNGGTSMATVTLSVTPVNDAPQVNAATFTLNENSPNGTVVGTVTFTDPDLGQGHTFAITAGNTGGAFAIDSSTGAITVASSAATNFETNPTFNLTVQVTDDGSPVLSGTASITININNVNDPPIVNAATFTVAENSPNGTGVGTVTFTDTDAGQTHAFAITGGNTGSAFVINASTGVITVAGTIDYETLSSYALTVQVTDNGTPAQSGTAIITINVTNVNELPVVSPATFAVDENSPVGTTVGSVSFTDPDVGQTHTFAITAGNTGNAFGIDPSTGAITVVGTIDYETLASYVLTVQVTDNGTPVLSGTATVTINVNNLNDPPVVNAATLSVNEGSPAGTTVGTVTFVDTDAGQTHTFAILEANVPFAIDASTGVITAAGTLDYETLSSYTLTVQVTDNGTPTQSGTATITINILNINEAPVANPATFAVNENSPVGTAVGAVTFTDPDTGQAHTFAITAGNTGGAFAINASTGEITVAGVVNYETTPSFSLTVQVTDNGTPALSSTATVTIGVSDINESPIAGGDTYNALGNTQLRVAGAEGSGLLGITAATNVLANDSDPDTNPAFNHLQLTAASGTSANGGDYSLLSDGSFTYTPPAGFTGTDTFTYTLTDGANTATGTVTISVGQRVWYVRDLVDSLNAAGGDGRSTDAFDSLTALNAATTNDNDIIFIFRGNTGTAPLAGGITLKNGQKLWGEGIGLTVPGFGTLVSAGSKPRVNNTTGDAVTVPAIAGNRQNVEIRGLELQGSVNGIDVTASGANNVGITISDNDVHGVGLEGVDLNAGSTGAFAAVLSNNALAATGNAFDARTSAAGTMTIDFHDNAVVSNATGILIDGSGGGTTYIKGFANNAVSGNTAGTGLSIVSAIFDSAPGASYQTVSGGTMVVGTSGNGVGASGVVMTNVSGALNFTVLDIFADGGAGLRATGSGAFTLQTSAGVGIIESVGGPAVDVTSAAIDLQLLTLKSTNSPTTGVALNTITGTFSAGSGSTISNIISAAGTAFQVGSSNATISYAGTISATTGTGVSLTSNTGSTISFTGTLTLSTGTNPAFVATGGGTVTTTDTASTLTTTTGTALNVANTTIGAGGLKFRSISANGGANGIVLDTTGSSGGLTVSGTGSLGTGGTIRNMTGGDGAVAGSGIYLNNTSYVSLAWMQLNDFQNFAIRGTSVSGFTLNNSVINGVSGNNAGVDEAAIRFDNLFVTGLINNSTIEGGVETNIRVINNTGTLNALVIQNSTIRNNSTTTGGDGIFARAQAGATMTVKVLSCTLYGHRDDHIATDAENSGVMTTVITGNTLTSNGTIGAPPQASTLGGQITVTGGAAFTGTSTFNISNNIITGAVPAPITVNVTSTTSTASGLLSGTISGNQLGQAGAANSGSRSSDGMSVIVNGAATINATITNNQIRQFNNIGMQFIKRDGAGNMNLTVTGNTVAEPVSPNALQGILVTSGATSGPPADSGTVCADIGGAGGLVNTVTGPNFGGDLIRVRQRFSTFVRLPGYGGGAADTTAVANYLIGRNTITNEAPNAKASATTQAPGSFLGGAACTAGAAPL